MLALALLASAVSFEFIYEKAPFPQCHASTIVETAPGEFLASWFGGTKEGAKDVAIWAARRTAKGWTAPYELAREPNIPSFNPVFFKTNDGVLWFYYRFGDKPSTWTSARRSSTDGGKTWNATEYLPAGIHGPIKNKPLVLSSGTVLAGSSFESYQSWASWIDRSTDNGRTWTQRSVLLYPPEPRYGTIQPALAVKSGKVFAFVRTTGRIGKVLAAESNDDGRTWTDLRLTNLPNPNSGIDATALGDGRLLLVYNDTTSGRSPLTLGISSDGASWTKVMDLETDPGEYSYPAIIQAQDGSVHITYTWRRTKVRHVTVPLASLSQSRSLR